MALTKDQMDRGNFFVAVVVGVVAVAGLVWSRIDANTTYNLALTTLQEAQKERDAQDRQFDIELKNWGEEQAAERAAREEDRKNRERQEATARAPFLAITQCCNQVAVGIEPNSTPGAEYFMPLVLRELSDGVDAKWVEGANARLGLVTEVQNLGHGAAAQTEVFWHPLLVTYVDGTTKEYPRASVKLHQTVREEIYEEGTTHTAYTWPNLIPPNGKAEIGHLPDCIHLDSERKIKNVEGFVELTCLDIGGKFHRFTQQFDLETVYEPRYEGDPPSISCHFYQLNSMEGPKLHNVAKMPIPSVVPRAPETAPAAPAAPLERTIRRPPPAIR